MLRACVPGISSVGVSSRVAGVRGDNLIHGSDQQSCSPSRSPSPIPSAIYANNPVETDHGRLKARLRPMRGLKHYRSARILTAGHGFVQNLRRGHYDIAMDVPACHRLRIAFDDLATTI